MRLPTLNVGFNDYEIATAVDVGKKRRGSNQDSIKVISPDLFQRRPPLLVLADGMGGYKGGRKASQLAVQTFKQIYLRSRRDDKPASILNQAVQATYEKIIAYGRRHPDLESMGTTVVAIVLWSGHVDLVNIGDSRAYIVRQNEIIQFSQDQSIVADMVRAGQLSPEEARADPKRNQLSMSLSARRDSITPFFSSLQLEEDDVLLLCSDGLWGSVRDILIQAVCLQLPPKKAANKLVQLANDAGGVDNISLIIAMPRNKVKQLKIRPVNNGGDDTDPGLT